MPGKHIVVVGSNIVLQSSCDTGINESHLDSLQALYQWLSSADCSPDAIVLTLNELSQRNAKIFEVAHSIGLLCRANNQQEPALGVLVEANSASSLVRDVQDTDIKAVVPDPSWLGQEETDLALGELLAHRTHLPKKIMDHFLRPGHKRATTSTKISLTPRQRQVLHLITNNGASNKVIARSLRISESTVKLHISCILKKFGVRNRTQLALFAISQPNKSYAP